MGNDFLQRALDPYQYDSLEIDWEKEGLEDSPIRRFFRAALKEHLEDLHGKSVIDIGSGLGHLFPSLKEWGAGMTEGVDPSKKNVALSRKLHPDISVFEGTLEEYSSGRRFDVGIAIMVFEHIDDLHAAFQKVAGILKPGGSFYLIAGNRDYFITPRFNYQLATQELGSGNLVCRLLLYKKI